MDYSELKACALCVLAGVAFGVIYVLYVMQANAIYFGN